MNDSCAIWKQVNGKISFSANMLSLPYYRIEQVDTILKIAINIPSSNTGNVDERPRIQSALKDGLFAAPLLFATSLPLVQMIHYRRH